MDVDRPSPPPHPAPQHTNAQAGPSSRPEIPVIFAHPTGPLSRRPLFDSTQDLLGRFQLLPAYDKYVRPYVRPIVDGEPLSAQTPGAGAPTPGGSIQPLTPGGLDKGKGKEIPVETPGIVHTPGGGGGGDAGDGDEEDGAEREEKKKKNSYKHLIKGVPGKHSMKKDDFLQSIMQIPPKQKMSIVQFDLRTQREAFSVSLEGLKGWNINTLVAESAQAREDRKKRKELKKLAKAQTTITIGAGSQPLSAVSPSAPANSFPSTSTGVPAGAAANSTAGPRRAQTPSSTGTPRPGPIPPQRGGSRPPGSGPGPPPQARAATPTASASVSTPRAGPSAVASSTASDPSMVKRVKKREHEDDSPVAASAPGLSAQKKPPGSAPGLRVGVDGARPRPLKKPRTDSHPHGGLGIPGMVREVPQQQPTPQGV